MIPLETRQNWKKIVSNHFGNKEIWAFHPRTDSYLVSNKGSIKSLSYNRIMKPIKNRQGYNMVNIKFSNGNRRSVMIHRMVLETFLEHFDNKSNIFEVNHMDGNKDNNSFENLEWVTRQENLQHARENGLFRILKGEENGNCKLKDTDIKDIRELYSLGFKIIDISRNYDINRTYAYRIIKGDVR